MKKFKIFQVNDTANRYLMFSSLDLVKKMGMEKDVVISNYNEVYDGLISDDASDEVLLERLFVIFNSRQKPNDYKGHSMSVSDVIQLEDKYYYTDSFGFEEIKNFA